MNKTLRAWFLRRDPTLRLLTAEEWAARESTTCGGSALVVLHDGGPFSRYGDGRAWKEFARTHPAYWQEQLTGWATALYRKET